MRLTFIGADHEVTGSCHYLECGETKLLVDCGMEQGVNVYENAELPVSYAQIDYVLLTHAHIDHAGLLPFIYARGFRGKVVTTMATVDLCRIMLKDSAHIQEMEAEWRNRKARRAGKTEVEALYTMQDAEGVLGHFEGVAYGQKFKLNENITLRFTDVGHLLGSASIEIWATEGDEQRKIVFSGDIGNKNKPLIRDPQYISDGDYVVMESTYGNRYHKKGEDHVVGLARIIQQTLDRQGNVVIPAFAVGRTQELLYMIRHIKEKKLVTGHDGFQVYVDSPLALEATQIYDGDLTGYADEETIELLKNGFKPISFPGLKLSRTSQESMALNTDPTPKVIIASSGMCEAGRIRHHLKHNLWRPECSIVFVGYQSEGTMGRQLLDGLTSIKLFGEKIAVRAEICSFKFMSSHADKNGLIHWLEMQGQKPQKVFIVHGEETAALSFRETLQGLGYTAEVPLFESEYSLMDGACLAKGRDFPRDKEKKAGFVSEVFRRLLAAVERLTGIASGYKQGANRDVARFADEVEELCRRWEK